MTTIHQKDTGVRQQIKSDKDTTCINCQSVIVSSHFQPLPVASSRFQPFPVTSSRFQSLPAVSSRFQSFPVASSRFQSFPGVLLTIFVLSWEPAPFAPIYTYFFFIAPILNLLKLFSSNLTPPPYFATAKFDFSPSSFHQSYHFQKR